MTDEFRELKYRLFQANDILGVMKLWEVESGWGGITEEQFYKWYVDTPFGKCLTVLAVDQCDIIVGQTVFMPSKVRIDGQERKAFRVLAPIIGENYRNSFRLPNHPFFEMYKLGWDLAIEQGAAVFYTFPIHNWLAVMRHFPRVGLHPIEISEFDCYSLRLSLLKVSQSDDIEITKIDDFSGDFDKLWDSAVTNFPITCGIVRNAEWLNWKLGKRLTFEARNISGELIAYFAIDTKTFLLSDALAKTPADFEKAFAALLSFLKRHSEFAIKEIKLMKTDFMQSIIEKFDFCKLDFKFAFGCYLGDANVSSKTTGPNEWYLMPND